MATMLTQVTTKGGQTTFYLAKSTFPNTNYYEVKAQSNTSHEAVLFVSKPPTGNAEGVVYCSVHGDASVKTEVTIDGQYGG